MQLFFLCLLSVCTVLKQAPPANSLHGEWLLQQKLSADPTRAAAINTPAIRFDTATNRTAGSTGCNRFSGDYVAVNGQLRFDMEKMALTRMACVGDGERIFLEALKNVTHYSIDGPMLHMMAGKKLLLSWQKK
jgi:heat shock protein HslJ